MALEGSLEVDLLLNDVGDSKLNVSWKVVVSATSSGGSVKSSVSQVVVLAWEKHLEELLEGESSIAIVVKELHKGVGLRLSDMVDTIVSEEIADLSGGNFS